MRISDVEDLHDFLSSDEFNAYESDYYGNDRYINLDNDQNSRIDKYAETVSDGRKNCEVLHLQLEALNDLIDSTIEDEETGDYVDNPVYREIKKEIQECIKWHEEHGTYEKVEVSYAGRSEKGEGPRLVG